MSQYYLAGIVPVGSSVRDEYPLVQSRCHYEILDVYTIANVVQDYHSKTRFSRDVEYVFPLPPSAAVCSFKAVIDDTKVIQGIIKEKEDAKREFKEAVAQGKTAGLLQQEHADVFRVSLGNIQPTQKISVHISFVSIVPHDGDSPQTLRITMPTAIAPRYGQGPLNIPWSTSNAKSRFELIVAIQMSMPITSVASPSHPIGLTLGSAEKELKGDFDATKAFIYLSDTAFLDKDIVIVIAAQGLDVPRCSVERWLANEGAEETTDAYALTLVPKFDLPALPSQEYIFLVDRSGSMAGGRMEAVKSSLQIMLRSLPSQNTTFNIVSFGSHYTSLWPKSRMYTAETVAHASKHVDTFTASYGGTEIRAALRFAFQSRLALAQNSSTEKPPASVFVLTDGEAWDLKGVVEIVTDNVEAAKKQNVLLRTFVLGVGNQVSTAMCEGIARAGKGSAVFVATGEKPDAKLMSLLKAARGAVIEDLTVDWGISEAEARLEEEDFELVSGPSGSGSPVPQSGLPPINLFDERTPSTDTTEIGPKKTMVHLPPPPVIQQAPKSDKLPIPLYPGFRCSIFAIIKQSSNPGPPSTTVSITGKVMGREVTFQTSVIPRGTGSGEGSRFIDSGKLLHTLAAKALIQVYEDMPTTPESKAQIERLGKRYSLASSMTSFLAIDEASRTEMQCVVPSIQQEDYNEQRYDPPMAPSFTPYEPALLTLSVDSSPRSFSAGRRRRSLGVSSPQVVRVPSQPGTTSSQAIASSSSQLPARASRHRPSSNQFIETYDPAMYGQEESGSRPAPRTMYMDTWYDPTIEDSSYIPEEYAASGGRLHQRVESQGAVDTTQAKGGSKPSPFSRVLSFVKRKKRSSTSSFPELQGGMPSRASSSSYATADTPISSPNTYNPPQQIINALASSPVHGAHLPDLPLASQQPGSSGPAAANERANSTGPLTLESIVRAQQFNGSFPNDQAFLAQICGNKQAPSMPAVLRDAEGKGMTKSVKLEIWATVLVLACLRRKFAAEKDSWEIVAEKALVFVENALGGGGVGNNAGPFRDTLIGDAEGLF